MQLHLIQNILASKTAYALLWMLIHSLWQGVLISLVAGLLVNSTKKSAAIVRYKLLGCLLCSFMLISLITFYYELNLQLSNDITAQSTINISGNDVINFVAGKPFNNLISKAFLYIQFYKNYVVIVWMLIVVLKCLNMLAGLQHVYRLKHKQVFDTGEFWNERLKELSAKLSITKPVLFLKSAIAEMPMTAGHFKPVILFPAAALTNLPVENIEAILLHELAHIRRNDYLLNMLQSFVEITFFFNPAVLWLSSLIKEERENCCDDIALHQTKNKKQFIHALVAFKDQKISIQQAVSFSGTKYHLLNRLKRIITNNNKTLNTMEKTLLSAGIIITAFAAVAFTKIKQPLFSIANHTVQQATTDLFKPVYDTLPLTTIDSNTRTVISHSFNGRHYRLIEINGKKQLYINDVKIAGNKISNYNDVIEKLEQQIVIDKKNQDETIKAQAEALAAQAELMKENEITMADQTQNKDEELYKQAQETNDSNEALNNIQKVELEAQAKSLQQQAEAMKDMTSSQQKAALKAEAIALQQQAVVMKAAMKNQSAQMQAEALKAQTDYMNQQNLIKKAELDKQMEQLRKEQKKLVEQSEIMEQQQVKMKAEMDKQVQIMKQQKIQMKENMYKQNEQLREQHDALIKQLNQDRDSINIAEPAKPNK